MNLPDRLYIGSRCEKRRPICLFADADEIDFQDEAHSRSLRLENNWLVELTRDDEGARKRTGWRGWAFSVADFIDLPWPQTTTLVPSSSFYADDKPSGVFAVLLTFGSSWIYDRNLLRFFSLLHSFEFVTVNISAIYAYPTVGKFIRLRQPSTKDSFDFFHFYLILPFIHLCHLIEYLQSYIYTVHSLQFN